VGRAPALLGRARLAAAAALAAALAAYYAAAPHLPSVSLWWDVSLLAFVLIPGVFGLVWLALPLREAPWLPLAVPVGAALAVAFQVAGLSTLSNFAKLAAVTALAWWFLRFFEQVTWVALVAFIIPWVDIWSVFRGPTGDIVENRPGVFEKLSFAFQVPGDVVWNAGPFDRLRYAAAAASVDGAQVLAVLPSTAASARLGLPDLLFFALFLAAADRFGLRTGWTFLALTGSFGLTIALTVGLDVTGLPALPALAVGFLLPNLDLLWRRLRRPPA
jgi:hypothetical protein